MTIKNLTSKTITIIKENGETLKFEPMGIVPRVIMEIKSTDNDLLFHQTFSKVINLPEEKEDTIYIVSSIVLSACPDRKDLYAPMNSKSIKDIKGKVIGVRGLVR